MIRRAMTLPPSARVDAILRDRVVGRRVELLILMAAVRSARPALLVGPPGVSKTTIVRALATALDTGQAPVVWVTGDEQLTAHALVGGFDPALVMRAGYKQDHFEPGPLTRAMQLGGVLYVEEINRAPSGALNAMLTALSERYLEVPRLGRIAATAGFTVVGGANPLDDVGTSRLSRGLLDRFVVIEMDYQPRNEELEIVRRHTDGRLPALRSLAVDLARRTRMHPEVRHGASVRAAIDLVGLASEGLDSAEGGLDRETLGAFACAAFVGKLRLRPSSDLSPCELVRELLDGVLADIGDDIDLLWLPAPFGGSAPPGEGPARELIEEGQTAASQGGESSEDAGDTERPGLAKPGGGAEAGSSRSVPMTHRDRPTSRRGQIRDTPREVIEPLANLDEVIRQARDLVLRSRGTPMRRDFGSGGRELGSLSWRNGAVGELDVTSTIENYAARNGELRRSDIVVLQRLPEFTEYLVAVDHSGSMAGRKLGLAALMAGIMAELSAIGRARYGVIAFDDELSLVKDLDIDEDVEVVIEPILRLPEGRATDLSVVLEAAADISDRRSGRIETVLISDCMPTKGLTTFESLRRKARAVPSLHICYLDDKRTAIEIFGDDGAFDLYEWWARRWIGDHRVHRMQRTADAALLIDGLTASSSEGL